MVTDRIDEDAIQKRADPLIKQIEHFARVIRGFEDPLVSGHEGL